MKQQVLEKKGRWRMDGGKVDRLEYHQTQAAFGQPESIRSCYVDEFAHAIRLVKHSSVIDAMDVIVIALVVNHFLTTHVLFAQLTEVVP